MNKYSKNLSALEQKHLILLEEIENRMKIGGIIFFFFILLVLLTGISYKS
jgi:hypothetical protein